jgi:AcrR family transcriptional regulator
MSPVAIQESHETKQRLLDAAEELVALHGMTGVSLRDITAEAGVNVALVKYHFGSKDKLMRELLKRRMDPINEQRLVLLNQVEVAHPTGPLPLEKVLQALIEPVVIFGLDGGKEGRLFLRVFGRIFTEPASAMVMVRTEMALMMKRYDAAFDRALPGIRGADMMWRKMACLGVVQNSLLMLAMIEELPLPLRVPLKLIKGTPKSPQVLSQLVAFCAAGMRAQVAELK